MHARDCISRLQDGADPGGPVRARTTGTILVIVGIATMALGTIGWVVSSGDDGDVAADTSTTADSSTTSTIVEPTTQLEPAETSTSSSSTSATTTTTIALGSTDVEAFITDFAAAIDTGNVDYLLARLHPLVQLGYEQQTCRSFIETEILALGDYSLVGTVEESTLTFTVNGEEVVVEPAFQATVSFTYQGQTYESAAHFAPSEGEIRWFAECE